MSTNRDKIGCYKCRKDDHFEKDCLTTKVEKESDQTQQMLNLDEEQTPLKMLATDTYDRIKRVGSLEEIKLKHLNV